MITPNEIKTSVRKANSNVMTIEAHLNLRYDYATRATIDTLYAERIVKGRVWERLYADIKNDVFKLLDITKKLSPMDYEIKLQLDNAIALLAKKLSLD